MKTKGFSLVELMIVIVIIGVLAIIAMPAYKKYIVKSKMAESYSILDNLGKMQVSAYTDNKEFVPFDACGATALKQNMEIGDLPNSPYALFGYPTASGSHVNFLYASYAGKFNAAGTAVTNSSFFYPPALTLPIAFHTLATPIQPRYESTGSRCTRSISATSLGVTAQANYDWAIITAASDFKGDEGYCTVVARVMEAVNKNPQYKSGFMVFDQGE